MSGALELKSSLNEEFAAFVAEMKALQAEIKAFQAQAMAFQAKATAFYARARARFNFLIALALLNLFGVYVIAAQIFFG
jgi:hypothetical protein